METCRGLHGPGKHALFLMAACLAFGVSSVVSAQTAQKGADALKKEADKKATALVQEADEKAIKLVEEAKTRKAELVNKI